MNTPENSTIHLKIEPTSIGKETVREYMNAVGDNLQLYQELHALPPNALAAYVLRELINKMNLPAGTIHASQEIESLRIIPIEEILYCDMTISKPKRRKGLNTISAEFIVKDAEANDLLRGKSLVLIPADNHSE